MRLDAGNITWLKGPAGAGVRNVNELLDRLVQGPRQSGRIVIW